MRRAPPGKVVRGRRAQRRGRLAEWLCCWHLRLRGWRVVARRWRCPAGEIDILARRGRVLAIIEVKSRGDVADAAMSILPRQRRRIGRAAQAFLLVRPHLAGLAPRFDVRLDAHGCRPRHWPGVWHADG